MDLPVSSLDSYPLKWFLLVPSPRTTSLLTPTPGLFRPPLFCRSRRLRYFWGEYWELEVISMVWVFADLRSPKNTSGSLPLPETRTLPTTSCLGLSWESILPYFRLTPYYYIPHPCLSLTRHLSSESIPNRNPKPSSNYPRGSRRRL